jgi:hypothetical protein
VVKYFRANEGEEADNIEPRILPREEGLDNILLGLDNILLGLVEGVGLEEEEEEGEEGGSPFPLFCFFAVFFVEVKSARMASLHCDPKRRFIRSMRGATSSSEDDISLWERGSRRLWKSSLRRHPIIIIFFYWG